MYELIKINDKNYYINSPAKIGVYLQDSKNVYLIDSGNDKDAGKKIKKILEENEWNLMGILNTHSNADHIGGNRYLQNQFGCKIFSSGIEAAFTEHTILEPSFLYGGCPPKDLKHKFIMAKESDTVDFSDDDFPKDIEIIKLPGHFFEMVGFKTPDNVFYIADSVSSKGTLEKYKIGFLYDVPAYINTLNKIKNIDADIFVPSHAEVTNDIKELADYNIEKVNEVAENIIEICSEKINFELILKRLFDRYGLLMNFEQNALVGSTVKSYLSWLRDSGKLDVVFEENMMYWVKK